MTKILNQQIKAIKAEVDQIVKELHDLSSQIGNKELMETVSDLRLRINEPFMFVIVGEVKAGKSSFINALLATGKEITKVGPQPITDTVQQILYGENEEIVEISPHLKKIYQPVDILKEIAIVDTPGTNTIIDQHQEITERFIPASDLIVFVFEAKNPYRQSAWDFFKFIHDEWRKKIIFVLQQKDLMAQNELEVNIKGVEEYAGKQGLVDPKIFSVSAKLEQEGNIENSGFSLVRQYISDNITGGKAPILKLENNLITSQKINEKIKEGLDLRKEQYDSDVAFREDILITLDQQEKNSSKHVDLLVENLLGSYDRITTKTEKELNTGLSFVTLLRRSLSSLFSRKKSAKEWLSSLAEDLEMDMNQQLKARLNEGVVDLASSIQDMAKIIGLKIQNSRTILKNDHELFSNIAEKRSNVLQDLQTTFADFMQDSDNFLDTRLFPEKETLSPNIATGSGIAVIGVLLATVTNGMVFDITGGILTTIGLLFAGISSGSKKTEDPKRFPRRNR